MLVGEAKKTAEKTLHLHLERANYTNLSHDVHGINYCARQQMVTAN